MQFVNSKCIDQGDYRRSLGRFPTGVAVVVVQDGEDAHGVTVNSFTSVSLTPKLVLFCLKNESRQLERIRARKKLTINFLSQAQQDVSRRYAGKAEAASADYFSQGSGYSWIKGAPVVYRCEIENVVPAGDHQILVVRVNDMGEEKAEDAPLVYYAGAYSEIRTSESRV
ncbi:flavin reductase family protein [Epibacterium sp. Ofav1-8]|uniref:flavin reductase family protein n=1 Tax=Epibacterium sp. Ofav1-8 TaxID=2917735 RepID=UPI001EF6AA98|nr:flavin reductase family protein [Epibacterium sp. Ofav1-8]MCG7625151.1 flavin reductase family protein [Epibacterium sp. Ofav1-8]